VGAYLLATQFSDGRMDVSFRDVDGDHGVYFSSSSQSSDETRQVQTVVKY
jgi:hypothetical protein